MRQVIPQMRIGQRVEAKIKECVSSREFIVSFYGDLLRIRNKTGVSLQAGQIIQLEIRSLNPLSFQVVPKLIDKQNLSINVSV